MKTSARIPEHSHLYMVYYGTPFKTPLLYNGKALQGDMAFLCDLAGAMGNLWNLLDASSPIYTLPCILLDHPNRPKFHLGFHRLEEPESYFTRPFGWLGNAPRVTRLSAATYLRFRLKSLLDETGITDGWEKATLISRMSLIEQLFAQHPAIAHCNMRVSNLYRDGDNEDADDTGKVDAVELVAAKLTFRDGSGMYLPQADGSYPEEDVEQAPHDGHVPEDVALRVAKNLCCPDSVLILQ